MTKKRRRGQKAILATYKALWDKAWGSQQLFRSNVIRNRAEPLDSMPRANSQQVVDHDRRQTDESDPDQVDEEFGWGLLIGRLSGLAWVMGADWEESARGDLDIAVATGAKPPAPGREVPKLRRRDHNVVHAAFEELRDKADECYDGFERGLVYGRISALSWVQGKK
jgi:hypothetical protein